MRYFLVVILLVCFSCKTETKHKAKLFSKVQVEVISKDTTLNVRALRVDKKGEGIFATSDGRVGVVLKDVDRKVAKKQSAYAEVISTIKHDTIVPHFRAVALVDDAIFALSVGNPTLLYKLTSKDSVQLVYKEEHKTVFYDAMRFWNTKEGIAIGDPTAECMSVIVTRDGGNTWTKLPCSQLPKANKGEAAFAASNTNIAIVGDSTWVATGGKSSRVLFSEDKGKTWSVTTTPITQGESASGIFSIDFYDENNGFAIGGNYTKPEENIANKIRTKDGGKTWQVVADKQEPGYRSCVQYVPHSNAQQLVAVGFKGIDYSSDAGETWTHFSDESFYTLRFVNDSVAYAAGKGRIARLVFR